MQPLLQVRDLAVCYDGDDRPIVAVDGLTFDIARGESVGLLGESGCGKTTLGLTLLGLLPKSGYARSGSIAFMGSNLLVLPERQLQAIRGARIAMVYQEPGTALNPVLRIGNQIAEVLRVHRPLSRTKAKEEANALLAQVGLGSNSGIGEAYPHQLSGGEKQRAVIAQAIACHPDLVIADEPTAALDSVMQTEILSLLKTLQTKLQMALILISHDPTTFEQMVDRVLVMYAGRLVEEGQTYDVLLEPMHPYTRGLLRSWPATTGPQRFRQALPVIPGDPPDLAHLPAGCAFEPRCPESKSVCRTCIPQEWQPQASRRVACFNYGY